MWSEKGASRTNFKFCMRRKSDMRRHGIGDLFANVNRAMYQAAQWAHDPFGLKNNLKRQAKTILHRLPTAVRRDLQKARATAQYGKKKKAGRHY